MSCRVVARDRGVVTSPDDGAIEDYNRSYWHLMLSLGLGSFAQGRGHPDLVVRECGIT
jgi:hypothetical protein